MIADDTDLRPQQGEYFEGIFLSGKGISFKRLAIGVWYQPQVSCRPMQLCGHDRRGHRPV